MSSKGAGWQLAPVILKSWNRQESGPLSAQTQQQTRAARVTGRPVEIGADAYFCRTTWSSGSPVAVKALYVRAVGLTSMT